MSPNLNLINKLSFLFVVTISSTVVGPSTASMPIINLQQNKLKMSKLPLSILLLSISSCLAIYT